jgi:hypothetical protein
MKINKNAKIYIRNKRFNPPHIRFVLRSLHSTIHTAPQIHTYIHIYMIIENRKVNQMQFKYNLNQ